MLNDELMPLSEDGWKELDLKDLKVLAKAAELAKREEGNGAKADKLEELEGEVASLRKMIAFLEAV